MGFAAVARVTEGRWIACGVRDLIDFGLAPGGELKLESTICNEIRQSHEAVVIDHVSEEHPSVPDDQQRKRNVGPRVAADGQAHDAMAFAAD